MDNTKTLYTRIQHRRGTAAEWEANGSFVPLNGELIVYTPTNASEPAKIKIGDGETTIANLPFVNASLSDLEGKMNVNNPVGTGSFSMGRKANTTIGEKSFAAGENVTASYYYTKSTGLNTTASGYAATAEGNGTTASGANSHAEGFNTIASGPNSHAEGSETVASGPNSHAEGMGTIAASRYQHAEGSFNIADSDYNYLHIVGNGYTDDTRSNAYTLDKNGNGWYAGNVYSGSDSSEENRLIKKSELTEIISDGAEAHQYLTTNADGEATWEDKLCYEEHVVEEVIPETTLTYNEDQNGFLYTQPINNSVVIGKNYSINYNGTLYNCVAFASPPVDGVIFTCLGNAALSGMENDTGEPFIVIFFPSEMVDIVGGSAGITTTDGAEEITIAVNLSNDIVAKKIDSKFLPNPIEIYGGKPFKQVVTDSNGAIYLENRLTYGPYTGEVEILPETTFENGNDGKFGLQGKLLFNDIDIGNEGYYTVVYNGTEYHCEAFEASIKEADSENLDIIIRVIGDRSSYFERNHSLPFEIVLVEPKWAGDMGPSEWIRTTDGASSVTISIKHGFYYYGIRKIDPYFLPGDFFEVALEATDNENVYSLSNTSAVTVGNYLRQQNRSVVCSIKRGGQTYYLYPTKVDGTDFVDLVFQGLCGDKFCTAILIQMDGDASVASVQFEDIYNFGKITVGDQTLNADNFSDELTLVAGENVAITTDTTNNQITISATPQEGTTYSAGTGLAIDGTTINHSNSITAKTTYNQATVSPGYGGTFKITEPKYDAQGHITGTQVATITMPAAQTIPTSLKNPKAITIGSKTYDGSAAVTIEASDLGLSNALHFIGVESSLPASGTNGDVVLVGSKEYVYSNGWVELGDGDSHALKTVQVKAGNGLTGGGAISGDVTISHGDTSSVANVTASANKFITGLTFDTYGHVTGATTGNVELTYSDVNAEQAGTVEAHAANTTLHVTATEHNNIATALAHANAKGQAYVSGLYKITSNSEGHITAATAVTKADITALGIPAQDTTYTAATTSKEGLMSAADKVKLNKVPTTIQLTGAATGSATFNGNATLSIATTVNVMNVTQTSGDWLILDCN